MQLNALDVEKGHKLSMKLWLFIAPYWSDMCKVWELPVFSDVIL